MQRILFTSAVTLLMSLAPCPVVDAKEAGEIDYRLFDQRPDHSWNRLHAALWLRRDADGSTYGRDRLDPLLSLHTRHLTEGDSVKEAIKLLDEMLTLKKPRWENESLKRAVLQRDLWAVFDWSANREHVTDAKLDTDDRELRRQLRQRLVMAIRRLALDGTQIAELPDNYEAAVASKQFAAAFDAQHPHRSFLPPRLFDTTGPWIGLGTADGPVAPAHMLGDAGFSRSAFTVFLRLPGGRDSGLDYLKRLRQFKQPWSENPNLQDSLRLIHNPKTPQFPPGTQVALVRRLLLIDSLGQITPTTLIEQVQFRVYLRIETMDLLDNRGIQPAQRFFEFNLRRERLFAGQAGGLSIVSPDERDFIPSAFSHRFDPIEQYAELPITERKGLSTRMSVTMQTCSGCHREAGVLSFNSYTRSFGSAGLRPPSFFETTTQRADQMSVITKKRRYDWGLLTGLWSMETK